ncbi:MAG: VWA domain-containing protein [Dehalococcoidales bacterium]|nr:VWA domain-containing protein [Dehalococcoidales bacterium]
MVIQRLSEKKRWLLFSFTASLLLAGSVLLSACAAESPDTSKARSRAVINSGDIVPAEEIRVAEYVQYYDQYFPEPEEGETIGLDLRLGNNVLPSQGGMAWLQIGLQTKSAETEYIAPLNLAIVVDASGSMAAADKMPLVKQSLKLFLKSLNPDDLVAIITYDSNVDVVVHSRKVDDGRWIESAIDGIRTGSTTNLHGGMMAGFREVEQNFNIHLNNRVMLLTDGIANEGETNPEKIAADALAYNKKGIYLSTIGLGLEFNDPLLIQLAEQGEGGYSFVDNAQEMDRIFREQANSLKQRVADEVKVQILPGDGVRLIGLTGYEGTPPDEGASVQLWPMSIEDSQVVLAELQVSPGKSGTRTLARVRLEYFDELAQKIISTEKSISGEFSSGISGYDPTWDLEILRNVTVQKTAEGMREIDMLFDAEKYEQAWRIAINLEKQLTEVARLTGDDQMYEDAALMRKYQATLADAVFQTKGRQPSSDYEDDDSVTYRPYRGDDDYSDLEEIKIK